MIWRLGGEQVRNSDARSARETARVFSVLFTVRSVHSMLLPYDRSEDDPTLSLG